ncbi:MAG: AGCS family alanine or glycine:cation symporter [Porticoccus sp.]|jgi:AGCS family alanine or glycine:cation symporter|uniref:alanine/glycine:cation symporter family protein n=1 Tax=Porticoccus sp. TaxID=2024853 RepID=UPI0039E4A6FC
MFVINQLEAAFNAFANFMWSTPLVVLLVGGGIGLMLYSRFRPYRHLGHALALLRGRYNDEHDPGHVSHAQALSTALSGTLGLGNVAGVAIAISVGGPGAVFWMWVTAIIGVTTKFYTASLAVMYRGRDSSGVLRGGPMYVISEGLGKRWYPLAVLFAVAGALGTLPLFQTNQFVGLLREVVAIPTGLATESQHMTFDIIAGVVLAILALIVVLGRIERIGKLTVRLVPSMLLLYIGMTLIVLIRYWQNIPEVFMLIVNDAFSGTSVAGGALGSVIMIGVRRGAFSNEAGIGTESMAHGEAKTSEPIREGVVAMTGPIIDTLIVCSCTAFMILLTGVWQAGGDMEGVALTAAALEKVFPNSGIYLLLLMVALLSFSTIVTFWFYGSKCVGFLLGADKARYYTPLYLLMIVVGAVTTLELVNGLLIGMYAMMAIPTMVSTFLLAPRVNEAAHHYFRKMDSLAQ